MVFLQTFKQLEKELAQLKSKLASSAGDVLQVVADGELVHTRDQVGEIERAQEPVADAEPGRVLALYHVRLAFRVRLRGLLQPCDHEERRREPDRPAPVGVAAEHVGRGLAGRVVDAVLLPVAAQHVRLPLVHLAQRAHAVGREQLAFVQHVAQHALQTLQRRHGQQAGAGLLAISMPQMWYARLVMGEVDFLPGPGPRAIDTATFGKAGIQICYEIVFSGQVVDRRNRPDFLFNPSNDAWFGKWGPPQHLAQARLRAIEEGLPILRSTPTGISAVIDARGRVLESIPHRQEGAIELALPGPLPPTLFSRFGNWLALLVAGALYLFAIAFRRLAR